MLELFRKNYIINIIFLFLYVIVVRLGTFINTIDYQITAEDSQWYLSFASIFGTPLLKSIFVAVLIFFQAILVNRVIVSNRLSRESALMGALMYVVLTSLISENNMLCPALLANTFVIFALGEVMRFYKESNATAIIFNTGFSLAMASIFYHPYLTLVLFGLISLLILRSFKLKEVTQYFSGFLVVYFFLFVHRFWFDIPVIFFEWIKGIFLRVPTLDLSRPIIFYISIGITFLIVLYCLFLYGILTYKKAVQTQKRIDLVYWLMLFCGVSMLIFSTVAYTHLLTLAVPASILIGIMLSDTKLKIWPELVHFTLLALIIFGQFKLINF